MQPRKLIRGLLVPFLFSILPACFRPEILMRIEPWLCYLVGVFLILSQPSFPLNLGASEYRDSADRFSAFAIHGSIFLVSAAAAIYFLLHPSTMDAPTRYISILVGVLLASLGLALRIWSIRTLGKFFTATVTIHSNHELIQSGPYGWIRHPSYVGASAAICAPAVIYSTWLLLPFMIVALGVAYNYRIRLEEHALRKHFGHAFDEYVQRTGVLWPTFSRPPVEPGVH